MAWGISIAEQNGVNRIPDWVVLSWWWWMCTMMTSSNGNIFRVTGPLCWEFTGFDVSFDLHLNQHLSKQWKCRWFETPSCSLWRNCNHDMNLHNECIYFSIISSHVWEVGANVRRRYLSNVFSHDTYTWRADPGRPTINIRSHTKRSSDKVSFVKYYEVEEILPWYSFCIYQINWTITEIAACIGNHNHVKRWM